MRSSDFFDRHPVFTHRESVATHTATARSAHTHNALLRKHLVAGRILRLQRGLYAAVPRATDPDKALVHPYLVAAQLTDGAVVAYHAPLQFHGRTYNPESWCAAGISSFPSGSSRWRGKTCSDVEQLVDDRRSLLSAVLPLAPHETEFLDRLDDRGEIAPELLTSDPGMQAIIRDHPGLRWKALNVKKHHGIAADETGA